MKKILASICTGLAAVGALVATNANNSDAASIRSSVAVTEDAYCPIADATARSYWISYTGVSPTIQIQFNNVKMKNGQQSDPSTPADYDMDPERPGTYDSGTDKFYRAIAIDGVSKPRIRALCWRNVLNQVVYYQGSPASLATNRAVVIAGDEDPLPGDEVIPANIGWIDEGDYSPAAWPTMADYCFVGRWYDPDTYEIYFSYVIYCVDQNGHAF